MVNSKPVNLKGCEELDSLLTKWFVPWSSKLDGWW